jgi:hypothetical protein
MVKKKTSHPDCRSSRKHNVASYSSPRKKQKGNNDGRRISARNKEDRTTKTTTVFQDKGERKKITSLTSSSNRNIINSDDLVEGTPQNIQGTQELLEERATGSNKEYLQRNNIPIESIEYFPNSERETNIDKEDCSEIGDNYSTRQEKEGSNKAFGNNTQNTNHYKYKHTRNNEDSVQKETYMLETTDVQNTDKKSIAFVSPEKYAYGFEMTDIDIDKRVRVYNSLNEQKLKGNHYRKYVRHLMKKLSKEHNEERINVIKKESIPEEMMNMEPLAISRKKMNEVVYDIVAHLMETRYAMYPTSKVCVIQILKKVVFICDSLTNHIFLSQVCKAQKKSMIGAKVNHKCQFAKDVIDKFMEHDWDNKSCWNIPKLWIGEHEEYQLGRTALIAMSLGRNSMSNRVTKTVGMYVLMYNIFFI